MQFNKAWIYFVPLLYGFSINLSFASNFEARPYEYNHSLGKTHYMLQCQGCHKANGSGIQGAIPDLREFGINILASERGRKFYVAVPGVSLSPLNNRQLADVLNYIIVDILNPSEKHPQTELFDIAEITKYRNIKMKYVAQERAKVVAGLDKNH